MGYAKHVGRVGALAVALGVGMAVAHGPAVAWADPGDTEPAPASNDAQHATSSDDTPAAPSADADDHTGAAAPTGTTVAPADTVTDDDDADSVAVDDKADDAATDTETESPSASTKQVPAHATTSSSSREHRSEPEQTTEVEATTDETSSALPSTRLVTQSDAADTSAEAPAAAATASVAVSVSAPPSPETPDPVPQALVTTTAAAVTTPVSVAPGVFNQLVQSILGTSPGGPVDTPLSWLVLASARRFGAASGEDAIAEPAAQTTAEQLVANLPAVIGDPVFGTPDPTTGAVSGQIIANDPENKTLTYAVTVNPSEGKLVFDKKTGKFTYTPTAAQRILAQITPGEQIVAFTATVSDGVTANIQTTDVTVTVNPTRIADVGEVATGAGPVAVAVTNTRAYVTNSVAKTVTVIDTINRVKITDIAMAAAPIAVAVTPDGSKVYVIDDTTNLITVIDGANNQLLAAIDFGAARVPLTLTVAPNGKTLYVAGTLLDATTGQYNAVVTKVSTTTGKVSGTVKLPGAAPDSFNDVTVTPNGTRVYVVAKPLDGSAAGTVYTFASSSTAAKTVAGLGANPVKVSVSPDSTHAYVADKTGSVSVVDTKTNTVIATIATGGTPSDVEVNKDGSLLMVVDSVATTVKVYDTQTPAYSLLTTVPTNAISLDGIAPVTALSPDGMELYVTSDGVLQVVSLVPANLKPVVGVPTPGTSDPTTGVVTGAVGVTDPDHDTLSYTPSIPAKGTVVINPDGTFVYTPTAAARHAAAADGATTALKDTFTVTVSDGRRGIVTQTITVNILPANQIPTVKTTAPSPSTTTGIVQGSVIGTDKDKDVLSYVVSGTTAKGGVVTIDSKGRYTYTPTDAARYYASLSTATAADKLDTFTVTVDDGHGGVIANQLVTVKVSPKNTRPKNVVTSTGATTYAEQQGPVVVDSAVTVSNPTATPFTGATATLSTPQTGDVLGFTAPAGSGITGSYNAGTGVLALTGTSSVDNYRAALRSVTFSSSTDAPSASKVVSFEVTDGVVTSSAATKTIKITAVNDAPTVVTSGGSTTYTEQQGPVVVDGAVAVSDPDSLSLSGATATLSTPQTGDALGFTTPVGSGIKGTYNATTGVLTLTGASSVENYQNALRSISFTSISDAASNKTITFAVTDGKAGSATATKVISVTAINDAPTLAGGGNVIAAAGTPVKILPTITVADPDGGNLAGATVAITAGRQAGADFLALSPATQNGITGTYNATTGVLTLTGVSSVANYQAALRSITFTNTNSAEGTRTVSVTVTDGALPSSAMTVTATVKVNHAPVAGNDSFTSAEDKVLKGNVVTNDTDSDGETITVTLGSGASHGVVNLDSNGVFTYTPNVNYHGTDGFTYTVSDGYVRSNVAVVSITVTPVDDVLFKFNYVDGTWSDDAKAALQRAADALSEYFATSTPVTVTYDVMGVSDPNAGYLAYASSPITATTGFHKSFVQSKIQSATHADSNGATADGKITANFAYTFEYNNSISSGEYDFQTVAMHELLHTFGFNTMTAARSYTNTYWYTYDNFMVDQNGHKVIGSDLKFDPAYAPNVSGLNGGLYFNGPNAVAVYGGLVPLEPANLSHLRAATFTGANRKLMGPNTLAGTIDYRTISPLEQAMLKDLGYTMAGGQPQTATLAIAVADGGSQSLSEPSAAVLAANGMRPWVPAIDSGPDRQRHAWLSIWWLKVEQLRLA